MALPQKWNRIDILKLSLSKGLSYSLQKKTIERFENFNDLMLHMPLELASKLLPQELFTNKNSDVFLEQLELLEKNEISFVTFWDDDYPSNLKRIEQAPIILYYKGTLANQNRENISIVGTRHCSFYGKMVAENFVADFVRNGITIVSGMAYGIDTIAHRSAVKSGGITYAVIASGIDNISSQIAEKTAQEIIDSGGAIISEYKCGTVARPGNFPQRNRIISGMSIATVVIESDIKGGSLITARFALDQNREVFAVPGQINSQKSAGCNKLIHSNSAGVALSVQQILKDLGILSDTAANEKKSEIKFFKKEDKLLFDVLSHEPQHIDTLTELANMEISEILVKLLDFEFKGYVRQLPGKYYMKN